MSDDSLSYGSDSSFNGEMHYEIDQDNDDISDIDVLLEEKIEIPSHKKVNIMQQQQQQQLKEEEEDSTVNKLRNELKARQEHLARMAEKKTSLRKPMKSQKLSFSSSSSKKNNNYQKNNQKNNDQNNNNQKNNNKKESTPLKGKNNNKKEDISSSSINIERANALLHILDDDDDDESFGISDSEEEQEDSYITQQQNKNHNKIVIEESKYESSPLRKRTPLKQIQKFDHFSTSTSSNNNDLLANYCPAPLPIRTNNHNNNHKKNDENMPPTRTTIKHASLVYNKNEPRPHQIYEEFVQTEKYEKYEREIICKMDVLRHSNGLNDDNYDYALIVKDKIINNHQNNNQNNQNDIEMNEPSSSSEATAVQVTLTRLYNAGLIAYIDPIRINNLALIKVRAPGYRLEQEAERLNERMKLRNGEYTVFDRSIREEFIGTINPSCLFTSSTRQRLLDQLIKSSVTNGGASLHQNCPFIVDRFPLHMYARLVTLQVWIKYWQRKSSSEWRSYISMYCLFYQPLDQIAEYFGEQVAFYYAFLRLYTIWLIVPTLLGIGLSLTQVYAASLDSTFVPFFCLFMAMWATVFLEFWKRKQSSLAHRWGVLDYEQYQESIRPEYNPLYSKWKRYVYMIISTPILILFAVGSALLVLYMMTRRDQYTNEQTQNDTTNQTNIISDVDMLLTPLLWGFIIPMIDIVYTRIAEFFTIQENHEKQSTHSRTFVLRVFSLRFINSYIALYYYALADMNLSRLSISVLGIMLAGQMFNYVLTFLVPLLYQKWNIYIYSDPNRAKRDTTFETKDNENNHKKIRKPAVIDGAKVELSQAWEENMRYEYRNFHDFASLVLQFGFVCFFSMAFPFAPLCAFINNLIQMRAGAYKMCYVYRRPVSIRGSGMGTWFPVFQFMSVMAVLTNCALIGFTSGHVSDWFPSLTSSEKILAIFAFEHFLIFMKLLLRGFIPDRSDKLERRLEQERNELERIQTEVFAIHRVEKLRQSHEDATKKRMHQQRNTKNATSIVV